MNIGNGSWLSIIIIVCATIVFPSLVTNPTTVIALVVCRVWLIPEDLMSCLTSSGSRFASLPSDRFVESFSYGPLQMHRESGQTTDTIGRSGQTWISRPASRRLIVLSKATRDLAIGTGALLSRLAQEKRCIFSDACALREPSWKAQR